MCAGRKTLRILAIAVFSKLSMHIILKGFDDYMCKPLTEGITHGLPLELCISISDFPDRLPTLEAGTQHIWISAKTQRAGEYPDIDWNVIAPLDEQLIESMRHCEAVFLKMIGRYAIYNDIPYDERKRQYLRHLRYWNHMLTEKKIDLLLLRGAPHQCYDLVLYELCKYKGIRTLSMFPFFAVDAISVEESWEESGSLVRDRLEKLRSEYADPSIPVPLSDEFEACFSRYTQQKQKQWYMQKVHKHLSRRTFLAKWLKPALSVLSRKPLYLLRSIVSPAFWRRKLRHHTTMKLYDRLARDPDLTVPFVYVPLHMQPEATTCPMGGAFVDQELIVQLLASCLPDGVRIYVKENPNQGELCRDEIFYNTLHAIPSVTLVPRTFSTFTLIEHAVATAAATGTACFEGLFKGKPAMLFGHKYFQFAPGVYRIHSMQDCKNAVEEIFVHRKQPTLRELRMFLKAIEETSGLGYRREPSVRPPEPMEERARKMGEYINKRIQQDSN